MRNGSLSCGDLMEGIDTGEFPLAYDALALIAARHDLHYLKEAIEQHKLAVNASVRYGSGAGDEVQPVLEVSFDLDKSILLIISLMAGAHRLARSSRNPALTLLPIVQIRLRRFTSTPPIPTPGMRLERKKQNHDLPSRTYARLCLSSLNHTWLANGSFD